MWRRHTILGSLEAWDDYCAGGLWFSLEAGWWMDCADADEVAAQEAAVQRGRRLDATGFWDD